MPKINIDGKELEFKQGQTIIEASLANGIDIPHFCWHPKLSVSGNCRVCLVEIENMPKLAIACATPAADGMKIKTVSEKAVTARNAVMEFLLINHPLDCPICDEAGECKLQDYAYSHSNGESRFIEEKVHKEKRVPLGPYVMFDAERCISCSRCIRFCDEVAESPQLTFVQRGDRVTIVTYPGQELDNAYSLNVTDICPVGALTNRDFRFKARVWDMSATKTICNGCARGCNTDLWVRNNVALRLTPRFNEEVNSYWMCDYGRIETFKFINREDRVESTYTKEDGKLVKITIDEALHIAAGELKNFNKNEIAFIGSAFATCEDNYLFAKVAKHIGAKHIDFMQHIDPLFEDKLLRVSDKTPNSAGAMLAGVKPATEEFGFDAILKKIKEKKIKAVYLLEDSVLGMNAEIAEIFANLELLIVHATNFNKLTELANIVFPASTYAEKNGTIINVDGRVQRLRPAVATVEGDRTLDGMSLSRLDKFGTDYDKWAMKNKKDAKPGWKFLSQTGSLLGHKMKYFTAEDVFKEMSGEIKELAGLNYEKIGETGVLIKIDIKQPKIKAV